MTNKWIAQAMTIKGRTAWYEVMHAEGPYRGQIGYFHPARVIEGGITVDEAKAAAELCAAAPQLFAALEKIAGEAPAKQPPDYAYVAWPPHWSDDMRDTVNDMILAAFNEGHSRALWEAGHIAEAALAQVIPVPPAPVNERPTYSDPVWYKDYRIYFAFDAPENYAFQHDDYDGADDACDNRTGYAGTVDEAKAMIDEIESDS
jgi:hypothetical protein